MTIARKKYVTIEDVTADVFILTAQTTDATATAMTLADGSEYPAFGDDTAWFFQVNVVARRVDADDESAGYWFLGVIDRNTGAATTSLVTGNTMTSGMVEDTGDWNCTVSANTTTGMLQVNVTGAAGSTINWKAVVYVTSVTT